MSYSEWAVRLVRHFFGPQFANQRVRLMVTREALDQNFPDLGGTKNFLKEMRRGPEWRVGQAPRPMFRHGLDLYKEWKSAAFRSKQYPNGLEALNDAPPFLPYLCLLCLAWTEGEESFAANAYYARLDTLYPDNDLRGNLPQWDKLWDGLQEWTYRLKGAWGKFVVERLGGWNYVGIPRSQVIFTPTKIERFPELFVRCGLEPGGPLAIDQLRHMFTACEGVARPVLGPIVFEQIKADTPIGRSAVEAILEHFENWDGTADIDPGEGAGFTGAAGVSTGDIALLALQPTHDNTRWHATLALERDTTSETVAFSARKWRTRLHAETLVTVVDTTGNNVDANALSSIWTTGALLNGRISTDDTTSEFAYKLPGRQIRIFDRWVGELLVEAKSLPSAGPAYVLVHSTAISQWKDWQTAASEHVRISDETWTGLPNGQHLFCVHDTTPIPEELRLAFPGGAGAAHGRPRYFRLFSGTRCNSSTARRVYAEYDPPTLIVQAPRAASVEITGAKAVPLADDTVRNDLPGFIVRFYALIVEPGHAVITAALNCNGERLAGIAFGVHRDRMLTGEQKPIEFLDRFGENSAESGVHGVTVAVGAVENWSFKNGPYVWVSLFRRPI